MAIYARNLYMIRMGRFLSATHSHTQNQIKILLLRSFRNLKLAIILKKYFIISFFAKKKKKLT